MTCFIFRRQNTSSASHFLELPGGGGVSWLSLIAWFVFKFIDCSYFMLQINVVKDTDRIGQATEELVSELSPLTVEGVKRVQPLGKLLLIMVSYMLYTLYT